MRIRTALLKTAAAGLLAAALSVGAAHAQSWAQSQYPVTISNGTSLSPGVDMNNGRLFAVVLPAAWTAASLTFQASQDGITYSNMFDSTGTEVTFTAAASQYVINAVPVEWIGVRFIKVRSGTSGTPVNQGAARALVIITVPF